jgi:HEAT repeat protein
MSNLSENSQKVVDKLLSGDVSQLHQALAELPGLADKKAVGDFLADRLSREEDGNVRSRIVSGLAAAGGSGAAALLAKRLDPKIEENGWARYWAAIGLAQLAPADLDQQLLKAKKDPDVLIRAVAMRLLIENGFEEGHLDELLKMAQAGKYWNHRWAACKVFRRRAGVKALREGVEARIIPALVGRLHDEREIMDVRYQAALALGDVVHQWEAAVEALGRALKGDLNDWLRRACVDALAEIKRPETRVPLLAALRDDDAEIRVRAARALAGVLEVPGAVRFVAEELLRADDPPGEYFDALRQIDNKASAEVLADYLLHPDPQLADRASRALTRLGGEQAMRTLQAQRSKAVDTYTKLLDDADAKIMNQFSALMGKTMGAFSLSMWMHGVIFGLGVLVLLASLYVAFNSGFETFERYVGVGAAAGSLGTLLLLFYKDPLANIRDSVTNLVKVNVVFLGYVRQINQIDATFKQMFLAAAGFGIDQMKLTVAQIQDSVRTTMAEVEGYLGGQRPA